MIPLLLLLRKARMSSSQQSRQPGIGNGTSSSFGWSVGALSPSPSSPSPLYLVVVPRHKTPSPPPLSPLLAHSFFSAAITISFRDRARFNNARGASILQAAELFLLYFSSESDPVRPSGRYLIPVTLTALPPAVQKQSPLFVCFARGRSSECKRREGRRRLSNFALRENVRCVRAAPHATPTPWTDGGRRRRQRDTLRARFSILCLSFSLTHFPPVRPERILTSTLRRWRRGLSCSSGGRETSAFPPCSICPRRRRR